MKLYGLDGFEIARNFIPRALEPFCLQGFLEGDLQIEGKEVTEDVALDPSLLAMKDRTNLKHSFHRSEKARSICQRFLYEVATSWVGRPLLVRRTNMPSNRASEAILL